MKGCEELVARGMPAEAIRFIHDYPKPADKAADKAALFRDCRNGKVAVVMGSTEKMGTGTNIQDRAVALHHMDVPWRPADLEQREGRILRQGNKNPSVQIFNYVTEGTFDTVMWQTVERKARFIAQLKTGNTTDRTVADLGGDDLGNAAAATKAVATGDPRYVEQVSLEDDVKRLSAMVRAHSDAKARNAAERRSVTREVTAVTEQMVELDRALPALAANSSAPFAMSVRGKTYRERAEAAPVLVDSLRHAYVEGKRYGNTKEFPIAELRGVQVTASRMLSSDEMIVTLSVPGRSRSIQAKDFTGRDTASVGLVRRVENMVADTPHYRDELNRRHGRRGRAVRAHRHRARQTPPVGHAHRGAPDERGQPGSQSQIDRTPAADGRPGPRTGVESGAEPGTRPARGVRGRGAGPPRGTRRRRLGYPGVGGRRGGCGTR